MAFFCSPLVSFILIILLPPLRTTSPLQTSKKLRVHVPTCPSVLRGLQACFSDQQIWEEEEEVKKEIGNSRARPNITCIFFFLQKEQMLANTFRTTQ